MSSAGFERGCVDGDTAQSQNSGMAQARRRTYIKQWRVFRGLTQEQLAEKTGMSPGNISLIERGLQNYTQETLEAIAHALKCEPADLLSRGPDDPEGFTPIWERATRGQRQQIVEIAKTITKPND